MDPIARLTRRSVDVGGCWVTSSPGNHGYSTVWLDGRLRLAHVVSYTALRADIPAGLELDHFQCQNKACWNPWHVEPVTHRENMARDRERRFGTREPVGVEHRRAQWRAASKRYKAKMEGR